MSTNYILSAKLTADVSQDVAINASDGESIIIVDGPRPIRLPNHGRSRSRRAVMVLRDNLGFVPPRFILRARPRSLEPIPIAGVAQTTDFVSIS
jgi:hypothetical protein